MWYLAATAGITTICGNGRKRHSEAPDDSGRVNRGPSLRSFRGSEAILRRVNEALAWMLAVFAEFDRDILRDRVKAGIDQARKDGKPHGRPMTAGKLVEEMKQLRKDGLSKREIAKRLGVSRTSVIRLLRPENRS